MLNAYLSTIDVAVPVHSVIQDQAREFALDMFPQYARSPKHIAVFANTGIEKRHFVRPVEWYRETHSFAERNALAMDEAMSLSIQAAQGALNKAKLSPSAIDAIILVNSTTIATPSLDSRLIQALGLPLSVTRLPLWGLGCAGGAAGLALALDLVRGGKKNVLLVAVELCSTTFLHDDLSKSNFVGTALFADGASAAVISAAGPGPTLLGRASNLIPNTEDVMGWEVMDTGLKVRFKQDIPTLMRQYMPECVQKACAVVGWTPEQLEHHVLHPGGTRVMEAYLESLNLERARLESSFDIMRCYGNMSSPTVLFVMERFLQGQPRSGKGILTAMGPGFSAEHVLFEV